MRHFLNLSDAGGEAIATILNEAMERKEKRAGWPKGKVDADRPLDGMVEPQVPAGEQPPPGAPGFPTRRA